MLDAPERVNLGREQVPGPPDGMLGRERAELEFLLGEDLLHEPPKALVELLVAAAGIGEEKAALLDILADVLPGHTIEFGSTVSVEEEDRRLEQILDRGIGWGPRPAR